jgi:hypothetical protein
VGGVDDTLIDCEIHEGRCEALRRSADAAFRMKSASANGITFGRREILAEREQLGVDGRAQVRQLFLAGVERHGRVHDRPRGCGTARQLCSCASACTRS